MTTNQTVTNLPIATDAEYATLLAALEHVLESGPDENVEAAAALYNKLSGAE